MAIQAEQTANLTLAWVGRNAGVPPHITPRPSNKLRNKSLECWITHS